MSGKVRIALAVAASWVVVLGAAGAIGVLAAADLGEHERALLAPILRERAASLILGALLLLVPLAFVVRALFHRYVTAAATLVEDAQIIVAANPVAPRTGPRVGRAEAACGGPQRHRRRARIAAARRRRSRARGERAHRAGAKPPGRTHVRARPRRDRVQRRGAHPALQRPRDAAPEQAARRYRRGRQGAHADRAGALDFRGLRPERDHPRAGNPPRPIATAHARAGCELRRGDPGRAARAHADGPGARRRRRSRAARAAATRSPDSCSSSTTSRAASRAAIAATCCSRH